MSNSFPTERKRPVATEYVRWPQEVFMSKPRSGTTPRRFNARAAALCALVLAFVTSCGQADEPQAAPTITSASMTSEVSPTVVSSPSTSSATAGPSSSEPSGTPTTEAAKTTEVVKTTEPAPSKTKTTEPSSDPAVPPSEAAPSSKPDTAFKLQPILPVDGPSLPASKPVTLSIPAIGITSDLMELGLNPDGTVEVPSIDDPNSEAGWYRGSPTPGEVGPSIILGHIDSRKYGPGVFYDLDKLQPGDTIEVTRADGSTATFSIDKVQSYLKAEFPTDEVYGNINKAGIRLITCGGAFNSDEGSYESNIIAFGSLVE